MIYDKTAWELTSRQAQGLLLMLSWLQLTLFGDRNTSPYRRIEFHSQLRFFDRARSHPVQRRCQRNHGDGSNTRRRRRQSLRRQGRRRVRDGNVVRRRDGGAYALRARLASFSHSVVAPVFDAPISPCFARKENHLTNQRTCGLARFWPASLCVGSCRNAPTAELLELSCLPSFENVRLRLR
jgi:hypothetical protein